AILEEDSRVLWDRRARRSKRASAPDLKMLAGRLSRAAKLARKIGWHDKAATLDAWEQEAKRERELVLAYEGQKDPDLGEFRFTILRRYEAWGGDIGRQKSHYVKTDAKKFLQEVSRAAGAESPAADTVRAIVNRLIEQDTELLLVMRRAL